MKTNDSILYADREEWRVIVRCRVCWSTLPWFTRWYRSLPRLVSRYDEVYHEERIMNICVEEVYEGGQHGKP